MRAIEVSTIAPATLATALSPLTDQEIRERAAVLRDAGQLGARHATPPPRGELAAEAVELPPCAPLPREEIELRAVEASETIPPAYPRTRVVSEATLLSLRLRQYSRDLDLLASSAPSYEPGTLRRKLNAIRTQLAMVIGGVMVLLATACGASPSRRPSRTSRRRQRRAIRRSTAQPPIGSRHSRASRCSERRAPSPWPWAPRLSSPRSRAIACASRRTPRRTAPPRKIGILWCVVTW